jgi:hypothetical protein
MKKGILCFVTLLLFLSFPLHAGADNPNIVKIGGDVAVAEGQKVKNVVAIGGQITIKGTVTGHAIAIGGSVVLTRSAIVEGNVISVGGVIVIAKGAEVYGSLKEINSSDIAASLASALNEDWEGWSWVFAILSLLVFIGILILAILLVTLIPKPICLVSTAIKEYPFKVFFVGLLMLVSIVPLAVLLTISVLGIVFIPLEMAVVVCFALVGFIAAAQITGEKFFALLKKQDQSLIIDVFWGLIILWFVGWIPYVGWMIKVLAMVLGLGGVLVVCRSAARKWKKAQEDLSNRM